MNSFDARKEVTGIILFFCSIALLLIDVLSESVIGPVGLWVKNIGFGFLGISAYMIPVFLCYAAFDFFIEKRAGVSPIRIRSVILLMICVAALMAVSSTDFEYFKSLCFDDISGKYKATKAIALLWTSGPDSELITNPAATSGTLSGGLIGGSIACALSMMLGKVISILTLIVVLLSQVILFFHISLKKTAKTAVKYVNNAKKTVVRTVRTTSGNSYARGNVPSGTKYVNRPQAYNPNHAPRPANQGAINSPYVNLPANSNQPVSGVLPPRDPFSNKRMPVDHKTGFTDVSDSAYGFQQPNDPNSVNFGNRLVNIETPSSEATADFNYGASPRNPRLRERKNTDNRPSFLPKNEKQDFYDLNNSVYPTNGNKDYYDIDSNVESFSNDDLPQEIIDDEPYDYSRDYEEETVEPEVYEEKPSVRPAPVINIIVEQPSNGTESTNNDSAPVIEPSPVVESSPASQEQPTNSIVSESYDPLVGREVKTNEANPMASTDFGANDANKAPANKPKRITRYSPPPMNLLAPETVQKLDKNDASIKAKGDKLVETLKSFGIDTEVVHTTFGPAITRYELKFKNAGVKVARVLALENDIALAMAAISVRIEAPIPGTSLIGIEIPNEKTSAVQLSGLIRTQEFKNAKPLEVPLGKNISGKPIMCDLAKMPHLLIAGSTGSGKSVCINTILASILYHSSPNDVRMILVDPKVVELSIYNGIPHLLMPVVTDPKKAISALKWAALEMDRRYKLFAESNVRNLDGYNDYLKYKGEPTLPLILIVVDELADLMTLAKNEVEEQISRLAAMARAAGLHLILATQRPSVDVISGVIKANVPSRIAFAVSSGTDSRTILDSNGAEKLLGKGDMLYAPNSAPKAVRGQGAFLSDKEVDSIVTDLRKRYGDMYDDAIIKIVESQAVNNSSTGGTGMGVSAASAGDTEDELLDLAVDVVIEAKSASVSILQRRLGIGYPRAGKLIDVLEQKHVIGPFEGSKPRKVLINKTDWLEMKAKGN